MRKQEEVSRAKKQHNLNPPNDFVPRRTNFVAGKKPKSKPAETMDPPKNDGNERNEESAEMLAKSKRVLEAKAKLYDRLAASGGGLTNSDETCLVMFNKKKQDVRPPSSSSSSSSDSDHGQDDDDDDSLWTEYTDCLGRTRKCLKSDLEYFKQKDVELAEAAGDRLKNSGTHRAIDEPKASATQPWFIDTKGMSSNDLPFNRAQSMAGDNDDTISMMSKASKMEEMRMEWEHKEQENMNRDEIHYQDVLFDEARTHGVGYYAFSADQIERAKQQQELEVERERTLEAQRKRDQQRQQREKVIGDRVFAAKNRQRARLGLPPLEREEAEASVGTKEDGDVAKEDKRRQRKEEKERKKKEREEQLRAEERKQHLRPWDHGKGESVAPRPPFSDSDDDAKEWQYKPEKPEPMSQEQWNDMKRAQRVQEFAPVSETETRQLNRFTTIQPKTFKRRNCDTMPAPPPNMYNEAIRNELDANECPEPIDDESNKRRRAEFAPPPTFEYYGPAITSRPRQPQTATNDLETSIEAGLRFLREQSDKSATGTKQKWVSNADY